MRQLEQLAAVLVVIAVAAFVIAAIINAATKNRN